ncbi:unnamed protein product [Darwinula stevensoni]|uniref:Uncharacterized protein n=1 Tax=Darwinula stevensoni TaxID=69355 RepID=A0A7R8X0K7_9CRUS|nr:unnamed protein product [Darwinula stevensoni]CAG0881768.1 unnamed protein product [Darwinula stevensoni]
MVVIVYTGKATQEFAYFDHGEYPHDSNFCTEVLLRSLVIFNFNPAGHPNEDIVNLLSSMSNRDTCAEQDMINLHGKSQTREREDTLHTEEVTIVHNFKAIVHDCFPRYFKGHTEALGFRFQKSSGVTQMHVRMHAGLGWSPNAKDMQHCKEPLGPDLGYLCQQEPTLYIWTLRQHKETSATRTHREGLQPLGHEGLEE